MSITGDYLGMPGLWFVGFLRPGVLAVSNHHGVHVVRFDPLPVANEDTIDG